VRLPACSARGRRRHGLSSAHEHAHPASVADLGADAARAALAVDQHHVGGVDVALLLEDPAGARAPPPGLQMALVHAHLLHAHAAALGIDRDDPALLAAVGSLDDAHHVALPDAE